MKKFSAILFSLLFLIQGSLWAYSSNPKDFVNELVNDTIKTLSDKNLSKEQIDKVWSKLDKDGDGRISISEFYDMMDKKKKKCEQEKSAK